MYEASAEFYDPLHGRRYLDRATALADRLLAGDDAPRIGIVDVGAGTGLATAEFARRFPIDVHAVEPSACMRAILLSRLAGHDGMPIRVRVHDRPVQRLGLDAAADVVWCMNMLGTLGPDDRAEALAAMRATLVPGGRLIVERPPDAPREPSDLGAWDLGGDRYSGSVTCDPVGPDAVVWRFVYRVSRDGTVLREVREEFPGFLVDADGFTGELHRAGFVVTGAEPPDIVVAAAE
jgi:SAM-dependent methyltransferase